MKADDLPIYYNAVDVLERNLEARDEMADYKRPRWIEFVDELPRTAIGKIQRFRLRSS